jgi:ABC-type sugar transport system substrate-binding protein
VITRKITAAGAVLAAAVVILAACSSSSTANSGIPALSGSAQAGNSLQAKAEKITAQYMHLPASPQYPWGAPYKPGHGTAEVVACGFAVPACAQDAQWAADALHAMGWQSGPALDGQDSAQVQASFLARAVQQKMNGVILIGVDVNTIPEATQQAAKAGVHIVCVVCNSGPKWKGKVVDVTPDWTQAGVIAAWEVLAHSGDHAKIVQFYDAEFTAVTLRDGGVEKTIKANCPACTLSNLTVTANELGGAGPPPWTAYLQAHPTGTITDAIAQADSFALIMSRTDVSEGRVIPIGGWDGDPPNITALITGSPPLTWTVAHPYDFEAWTGADVLGRWKAGQPFPKGLGQMPLMLVTKANAAELAKGNPAGSTYPAPPGDWQGKFLKLWGKGS